MLICPKCKEKLHQKGKSYYCANNHCYDIAKKGYINLLLSQASSKKVHGDDKLMSLARRDFLSAGHYRKLLEFIAIKSSGKKHIVDVGCGEGYYTCGIYDINKDSISEIIGLDISKDIIMAAATRKAERNIKFAVANCASLPISDLSADCIISIFAPLKADEALRILSDDGIVIRVTPGSSHLYELKQVVYDNVLLNDNLENSIDGLQILSSQTVNYKFSVNNVQLKNLFTMTPYYYKTSDKDRAKLDNISNLEITAEFIVTIYKKAFSC